MDERRRDAPDRRPRGLPRAAERVRLPVRPHHEAGVRRRRRQRPSASSTPRARTSGCCARRRSSSTRHGAPDADRPADGDRGAHRAARPALEARAATSTLVDPDSDPRYREYWRDYHRLAERKGVTPADRAARDAAPLHADRRDADAHGRRRRACCAASSGATTATCASSITSSASAPGVKQLRGDEHAAAAASARCSSATPTSTSIRRAEQIAEMTVLAAEEIRRFGIAPKVALLSHSSFGAADTPTALKMREALRAARAARAGPRSRRRDARRRRALRGDPQPRRSPIRG